MSALLALAGTTAALVTLGVIEEALHRRRLSRIPVRVHVNGTRGKSSVTRLIAGALRASGRTTCAKTTGTLARMILPDGTELPVFRPAGPNVIEQVRIVRTAAAYEAQALVLECMAVTPQLQWLSERKLVRATHAVVTNVRADHLEVMGPEERDVAWALAGSTPVGGRLYTAEQKHLDVLDVVARDRGTELIALGLEEIGRVSADELARFSYGEHAANVALALRVAADLGVERDTALRGMWAARPDPGVSTTHELSYFGRRVVFVNAFAANDPASTELVYRRAVERFPDTTKRIAIFNCRDDRPERSRQLAEACVGWPEADHYVLVGTGTYVFARAAERAGLEPHRLVMLDSRVAGDVCESLLELAGANALLVGMGNTAGIGLPLVRWFRNREPPPVPQKKGGP